MNLNDYIEHPGVDFRIQNGANFDVFGLTLHNHLGDEGNPCSYRYGVMLTILGVGLIIGWFRSYPEL